MGRGGEDEALKPSDLTEAQREALKRQYRGVFWDRKTKRWRCQLGYQSKKIFLGYFDDAGEAARAYDQKLVELRGAGARTNFPITEYIDMMPTPTKRGGPGAAVVAAAAAAAAARDNDQAMEEDEDDDGEEIDQPASTAAAAADYGTDTPSLDPGYGSATAGGRISGLLEPMGSGQAPRGYAGGSSTSLRQDLSHLPAIAPLSTELPCEPHAAALAAQDFDMAGEDELTAAAQLAIEIRRSFDGSNFKWQQQQQQQQQFGGGHHQMAAAASSGSAGGSAGAAAAAGYDMHQRSQQQQQQQMGAYRNDTAAAAAAGYGGNASLYGTFGHHHHAGPHPYHHHQQQQHYAGHHVRNGTTTGELYGGSQGWADPAAAAAAGRQYEGHPASYDSSHYPHSSGHQQQHHHSHPGVASAHGGFSESGGLTGQVHGEGYPMHHQQQQHSSHHAAAAAAAGYGHQSQHAAFEQQQARHYQHQQMYHQQHQRPHFHQANGDDQQMAAAGHMQQQQQHYMGPHAHQQQQHGHYPLHHSHSYPGASAHENGMEGAAAAGYYGTAGTTGGYVSHAQAVAAHRASQQGQHYAALHAQQQQHAGEGMVSAQGMYGSSGELQHYGGGLAAAQQQQQYDARAAASNPAVASSDYRQRLATYGLHGYASDPVEYRGPGVEGEGHPDYPASHLQQYQQHMRQDGGDLAGATAMDAAGPGGGTNEHYNERFNERYSTQHAAYEAEDPWVQSRGGAFGRSSAAGSDGGFGAEGAAAGAGLPAVRTTRASGRTSRGASRALAVTAESDEYDIDDDEDYGSDSDTGRGRGRNSRRRSRTATAAAAVGHGSGEGVLRTKQRDGGDDERGHSYRGVFWDKKSRRWRCQLGHKNKKIFLGYFGVAEDAARAYDQKLVELHGVSAKTNFPLQNYLGEDGSQPGSAKDALRSAAAAAAESPRAPGGLSDRADVPTRRRSSYAGDGSAKASHGQHSELSWGVVGFPRSSRLSHDASEGAPRSTPRLSWAGMDTLSSWDQQDPESQYAKRRRLLEGGAQLPTSPQDFSSLAGAMHSSHQGVGGDDMLPSSLGRQGSGYRVVETPSVLTANLAGRHSSSGQQGGSGAPSIDAAATTAGLFGGQQVLSPTGGRSSLALSRLASGEMGAVQALSGLHTLSARSNSGPSGFAAAAAEQARMGGSSAVDAVLAAAGGHAAALGAGAGAQQQQQSQASRLFDEAVHQYGGKVGGPDRGPLGISAVTVTGRVSDPNTTGTSSSTATQPSGITAGGQFGASRSPLGANAQAALSRLNSSEVRAVQALSGIHNDLAPFQARVGMVGSADGSSWGGFGNRQSQQVKQQQSPASITETVAKDLICRAPVVSAIASSSIATVAAAAAIAAAAKAPAGVEGSAAGRSSADGSLSGLLGEIAAGLGEGHGQAGTPPDALNPEQLTPGFSPLLASSSLLLPPPPPLQLDVQEGVVGAAAAAAAAAAGSGRASGAAGPGAEESLAGVAPGDAFAAEAGWGNPGGVEDLLMPKKRPSCSGSSGLIGLLGDIGQFKTEADAAAAAVVVPCEEPAAVAAAPAPAAEPAAGDVQQQQQQQQQEEAAAGDAAAADRAAESSAGPAAPQQQPKLGPESAAAAAVPAVLAIKAEHVAAAPAAVAAELQAAVPPATATAALAAAPVAFMPEPMAVVP